MDRKRASGLHVGLPLIVPLCLGGCGMVLFEPKGQVGHWEMYLILTSLSLMLIVVVPAIVLALLYSHRYRPSNPKAEYKPEWHSSREVEELVWGVPFVITIALAAVAWVSTYGLNPAKPIQSSVPGITINVVALNWKWLFIYPDENIAVVNQVAFPVDAPVTFNITSDSVMNSFFIPQLGSQIYAMAGMRSRLNLIANEVGSYDGLSANFSGDGFSGMTFKALAISQADFSQWLAKVRRSPAHLTRDTYAALAKASSYHPVQYYSSVEPHFFDSILGKYKSGPMPMQSRPMMGDKGSSNPGGVDVR